MIAPESDAPSRWRGPLVALGALLLLLSGGVVYWLVSRSPERESASGAVAQSIAVVVLPFEFQGSEELTFLREGLVDLLGSAIDGVAGRRSVDPHAVLGYVRREASGALDPSKGRAVAQRFGAEQFVLGRVVETAGRVQLEASLHVGGADAEVEETAAAEGEPAQLPKLVHDLTAQLTGSRATSPSTATTESFPALKEYLQGEAQLRSWRAEEAVQSFRRAISLDPRFGLAHLGLAVGLSREWVTDAAQRDAVAAARKAIALKERLPERDRRLAGAFYGFVRGRPQDAEKGYRGILEDRPDDWEAWHGLGETLFQYNALRGRATAEARPALERALELDPGSPDALAHLVELEALERNVEGLRSRRESLADGRSEPRLRLLLAVATRDEALQREALAGLEGASDTARLQTANSIAAFTGDLRGAAEVARALTLADRPNDVRARAHEVLARWEWARGRWKAAQSELRALGTLDPVVALEQQVLFALTPLAPVEQDELENLRERLVQARTSQDASGAMRPGLFSPHAGMHRMLRLYLLGLVGAGLGDGAKVDMRAMELEDLPAPAPCADAAKLLAESLRSRITSRRADALEHLERSAFTGADCESLFLLRTAPIYAQPHDRFLRAELLEAEGRLEEALGWSESLAEGYAAGLDLTYLAPSLLVSARLRERLGAPERALAHYQRFIELWQDCDPEVRARLTEAEQHVAELRSPTPAPE